MAFTLAGGLGTAYLRGELKTLSTTDNSQTTWRGFTFREDPSTHSQALVCLSDSLSMVPLLCQGLNSSVIPSHLQTD